MVRTQVQLTEKQAALLKQLSLKEEVSIAELIRRAVDQLLEEYAQKEPQGRVERMLDVVGKFRSGLGDLAKHHDRYFAETVEGLNSDR
ncbi:MAG: ribbon-helix-helix domain-containing protein [Syntrophomonadaceae bacterium]|nr:ribbon-helix-helix domain-containing protein [Syntrophomonadaceae bacterium]